MAKIDSGGCSDGRQALELAKSERIREALQDHNQGPPSARSRKPSENPALPMLDQAGARSNAPTRSNADQVEPSSLVGPVKTVDPRSSSVSWKSLPIPGPSIKTPDPKPLLPNIEQPAVSTTLDSKSIPWAVRTKNHPAYDRWREANLNAGKAGKTPTVDRTSTKGHSKTEDEAMKKMKKAG